MSKIYNARIVHMCTKYPVLVIEFWSKYRIPQSRFLLSCVKDDRSTPAMYLIWNTLKVRNGMIIYMIGPIGRLAISKARLMVYCSTNTPSNFGFHCFKSVGFFNSRLLVLVEDSPGTYALSIFSMFQMCQLNFVTWYKSYTNW